MPGTMRLTLETEGGFAHFPGLARPVEIDTERLPAAEAEDLERKVGSAGLFERETSDAAQRALPGTPGSSPPDARRHVLTVRRGGRRRTVVIREPVGDEALAELLAALERHRRRSLAAR